MVLAGPHRKRRARPGMLAVTLTAARLHVHGARHQHLHEKDLILVEIWMFSSNAPAARTTSVRASRPQMQGTMPGARNHAMSRSGGR